MKSKAQSYRKQTRRIKKINNDDDCMYCDGKGHIDGCDAREPAWDIADLICRSPCDGCCPNKCQEQGLQKEQTKAAHKARRLIGMR